MAQITQTQYDSLKERGLTDNEIRILAHKYGDELPSTTRTLADIAREPLTRVGEAGAAIFEPKISVGERVARAGMLPLRAGGALTEIAGGIVGEPMRAIFEKLPEEDKQRIQNSPLSKLVQKMGELTDAAVKEGRTSPELVQSAKDIFNIFSWVIGGGAARAGTRVVGEIGEKATRAVGELPSAIRGKITGIAPKVGEEKITQDALTIARERINPTYEERAAIEGRTFKEGRLGTVQFRPTRREELVADSIRPLVEQNRINPNALPFENIPEISLEVRRINQGVKDMIRERKVPFNEKQLRSRLEAVKKDSEIIFTNDPTLVKTYNSLIEAFIKHIRNKDTLGLFEARQTFDKLPAVHRLLVGMKGATGENLRRQAVLDIRRAANEYISDLLPKGNPYSPFLKQESYMLEAMTNLAEKSRGLGGTTNIERFLGENPLLKWTVRQAVPFGAGAAVF